MAEYTTIIERAEGNYSAYCPDLPGCIAMGAYVRRSGIPEADRFWVDFGVLFKSIKESVNQLK